MKKKLAGLALTAALITGAAPLAGTAHANDTPGTTDPVLCFVAAFAIITEALDAFAAGHVTGAELRQILVGTSSFLGDCLTPTT